MEEKMLKIDLHLHTFDDPLDHIPHSDEALIETLASNGFDGFAVTNHDSSYINPRLEALARERGMLLIRGMELEYKRQHVVLLNFDRFDGMKTPWDIYTRREPDNLVLASHPYFPLAPSCGRLLDSFPALFDAVEFSHLYNRFVNFNSRAVKRARELGLPMVGTSDAHNLRQIGHTYTLVRAGERSPEAVVHAIKEGRSEVASSPFPLQDFLAIAAAMKYEDVKRAAVKVRRLFLG